MNNKRYYGQTHLKLSIYAIICIQFRFRINIQSIKWLSNIKIQYCALKIKSWKRHLSLLVLNVNLWNAFGKRIIGICV